MDSNEYQVTIKSANQKVDDYVTKCHPNWTVHRLKQHISETHVNKPTVEEQRLIYAGNLLKDSYTLKQIFFRDSLCTELTNSSKTDFTIHLVCSTHIQKLTSNNTSSATATGQPSSTSSLPSNPNDAATSPSSSTSSPSSSSVNFIRVRASATSGSTFRPPNQQQPQAAAPSSSSDGVRSTTVFNIPIGPATINPLTASQQVEVVRNLLQSDMMRHQMAVFQHLAHVVAAQIASNVANNGGASSNNQIASSYMPTAVEVPAQFNQMASNPPSSTNNHIATAAASQMLYAAGNRQQTQFVPADGAAVAEPAAEADQMQVQAPVVDQPAPQAPDQEMMQRDVIDWVYYSVRAAVLMAALYIHATVFRLLFIVGLLAIAYFFNRRSTRRAQPTRHEQQPQPAQEINVPAAPPAAYQDGAAGAAGAAAEQRGLANQNGEQQGSDDNRNTNETEGAPAADQTVPQRVPILKLCYLVVTDFLASLVPD